MASCALREKGFSWDYYLLDLMAWSCADFEDAALKWITCTVSWCCSHVCVWLQLRPSAFSVFYVEIFVVTRLVWVGMFGVTGVAFKRRVGVKFHWHAYLMLLCKSKPNESPLCYLKAKTSTGFLFSGSKKPPSYTFTSHSGERSQPDTERAG